MAVSLVLFDMNGVLVSYEKDKRIAHLARLSGLSPKAVDAAIWGSGFEDAGDAGMMGADRYLHGFGEALGYPLTRAQWAEAQAASITPIAPMLTLAEKLRPRARIAVLTNNNLLVREEIPRLCRPVAELFGLDFHVSAEFGARKPEPDCFRACLEALGAAPAETLFIDDSLANVEGAKEAGLIAHHFQGLPALEAVLAQHLAD